MRNLHIWITGLLPAFLFLVSGTAALADTYEELIRNSRPCVALVFVHTAGGLGMGSAFAVARSSGTIFVTNHHVVEDAKGVELVLQDRSSSEALVLAMEPSCDLALLRVARSDIPILPLAPVETLTDGMQVMALGFPMPDRIIRTGVDLKCSVTAGLSSLREDRNRGPLLQNDLALNPGNSGGPILRTSDGSVVGVVSFGIRGAEGLNFGIGVESLRKLLARAGVSMPVPAPRPGGPPHAGPGRGSAWGHRPPAPFWIPLTLLGFAGALVLAVIVRRGKASRPPAACTPSLVFIDSNGIGHPVQVGSLFGRGDDVDVRLDHHSISRHHARLILAGNQRWTLEDLGSKNGLWAEGRRVRRVAIDPGSRVRLGEVDGVFVVPN